MLSIVKGIHVNQIKWLHRTLTIIWINILVALLTAVLSTTPAFAQTIDTSKIKAASQSIISAIQSICGIGVALLLVAGFGLFMWSVAPRHAL